MIFYEGKTYATVWGVKPSEKYIDLQITTGEKDVNGEWVNSGWFPRLIGHALNSLKDVKVGDRIIITKAKLSNERKQMEDGSYHSFFRFLILEAKHVDATSKPAQQHTPQPAEPTVSEEKDDDCPW